ncbi:MULTISPECIES: hypothetical protein [unclassified Pseudomonas]|uniref:hypothetical protein n=1 Tax=unclassified Pseudomonas TaxID=196821 RepID=UPI000A1FFE80|nr:hypothetical protein [Pseudomonas sp. B26(2017)]
MLSKQFISGFRHELSNRAFALMAVRRMTERLQGDERRVFWKTYWDLERFNSPRYSAAARQWGLEFKPGIFPKTKAWLISSVPRPWMGMLLKIVHRETVKYLQWLKALRDIGPTESRVFLNYMIEQEELQIELMQLALANRYTEIVRRADRFFLKYSGVILSRGE